MPAPAHVSRQDRQPHVKLRLFPQESAGLNLLSLMARQIMLATGTVSEALMALDDLAADLWTTVEHQERTSSS